LVLVGSAKGGIKLERFQPKPPVDLDNYSTVSPYGFHRDYFDRDIDRRENPRELNRADNDNDDRTITRRTDSQTYRGNGTAICLDDQCYPNVTVSILDEQSYTRGRYDSGGEARNNRFSAPTHDPQQRRRSPSPARSRASSTYAEEDRFRQGWGGDRYPPPPYRREPSPDRPYEHEYKGVWPREQGTHEVLSLCKICNTALNLDRYARFDDDMARNGFQKRRVPQEPKKYERKHMYLMDSHDVPYEDYVKLTHFVALDEFYVRFESEENRYLDMLAELRDDYKGELEFAAPQLWMKGDGVAVWLDRQWQRGVVCSPITNNVVATLDVFLIDVGKTVTISKDQVLPLHSYYDDKPPFAVCCTVGSFDIYQGRRPDLVEECNKMADAFMNAKPGALLAEIKDKVRA
ncbi:tudor domain protein, partial [Cooperia oncophora]